MFGRKTILAICLTSSLSFVFSQEALKSTEEEYYDFLSLTGIVERPTLGYRTLSDSEWIFNADEEGNIWQGNNLGTKQTIFSSESESENWFTRGIDRSLKFKAYGPEWYNSYNTAAPYGQNDGALWQGKGYNTSLTAGARLEGYGFELTIKPQLSWSQNREFDYIAPNYSAFDSDGNPTIFNGKASSYGYYGVASIDAPQRFGNKSFWTYDWGDTEIRWTWNTFTTGFGTQAIWLGPARLNPIIHSNNAASYPKFDIGLRKTKLTMPHFGWDLGYIEARGWWGKLTESDWFDNDDSNNHNLISGLSINYAFPGIFRGFSVGLNRTMLSKWDDITPYTLFTIAVPGMKTTAGHDENDQRASITFEYLLDSVGLDLYLEWGRNDYTSGGIIPILQNPFHTEAWTAGIRKKFQPDNFSFEILYEFTRLDCSQDYDRLIPWYTTFYSHHIVTQGHTNRGQVLGAGIGTGAISHYIEANFYTKKNKISLFAQRTNPDMDYTWFIDSKNENTNAEWNIKVLLDFGLTCTHFVNQNLSLSGGYTLDFIVNHLNKAETKTKRENLVNNVVNFGLKYNF